MKKLLLLFYVYTVALYAKAQLDYDPYRHGYYITNKGDTMAGYIRYIRGNRARIEYFKTGDKKAVKIYPTACREFLLSDSIRFIRTNAAFTVKVGIGLIDVTSDFVEVLQTGKVNLYMHHGISGSANFAATVDWDNLVVGKDSSVYIGLHPNMRRRKKEIEKYLKGEDELIEI